VFLYRGRILASEEYFRASGAEEHVDVEPPQLNESNWFQTSVETLGFLSLDGGVTWYWLNADVGFEGIDWYITRLVKGLPQAWEFYLYTYH
jgi:hypothetical protein